MHPKVLFLDVDGTLTDYHNRIPASAIRAIRLARVNGHRIYACTGRSKAEMQPALWDIGLDGMIGGNGSYVEHHGRVLLHQTLNLDESRAVIAWLHARGLEYYLESNSGLFASEHFRDAARPVLRRYIQGKGVTEMANLEAEDALHGLVYGAPGPRDDLNKISYILNSYQDYLDASTTFPDLKHGTWGGRGEEALFGDIGVKNINKAHAIDVLLCHLGATREHTIAFGDAKIDIPMLEYCAIGVAMGNGGAEIRAVADFITDDVEHDGLYNAFVRLQLITAE